MEKKRAVAAAVIVLALTGLLVGVVAAEKALGLPATASGQVSNFRMSDSCAGLPVTQFPLGTKTVYALFDYANLQDQVLIIRVWNNLAQKEFEHSGTYTGSGTECVPIPYSLFPGGVHATNLYDEEYLKDTEIWEGPYGVSLPLVLKNHR